MAAVVVAVVVVVGTFVPWSASSARSAYAITQHTAWSTGAVAATGAAVAVAGAVLLATAAALGRRTLVMAAAALAVAGAAVLLVDHYGTDRTFFYVSVGGSEPRNDTVPLFGSHLLPPPAEWMTVGALMALAVALLATTAGRRPGPPGDGRRRSVVPAVAGVLGAAAVVVGGTALPWRISPAFEVQPLWRADTEVVVGAVLVVAGGALLLVGLRSRRATAFALLASAAGLGLVLPARLPVPWGDRTFGVSSYQPLAALTADIPTRGWFDAATAAVLVGAVVVALAAVGAQTSRASATS